MNEYVAVLKKYVAENPPNYKANRTSDKMVYYKVLPGAGHGFKRKNGEISKGYLKEFLSIKK